MRTGVADGLEAFGAASEVLEDTRTELPRRARPRELLHQLQRDTSRPYDLENSLLETTLRAFALSCLWAPFFRSWSLMECAALAAPRRKGPWSVFWVRHQPSCGTDTVRDQVRAHIALQESCLISMVFKLLPFYVPVRGTRPMDLRNNSDVTDHASWHFNKS